MIWLIYESKYHKYIIFYSRVPGEEETEILKQIHDKTFVVSNSEPWPMCPSEAFPV